MSQWALAARGHNTGTEERALRAAPEGARVWGALQEADLKPHGRQFPLEGSSQDQPARTGSEPLATSGNQAEISWPSLSGVAADWRRPGQGQGSCGLGVDPRPGGQAGRPT